jgi:hypothetical protein
MHPNTPCHPLLWNGSVARVNERTDEVQETLSAHVDGGANDPSFTMQGSQSMMKRRFSLPVVAVLGVLGAAIALAATGIRPGKPTIVCLLASSGAQNCPAPSATARSGTGTVKWNPGHYIRVGAVNFTTPESERRATYEQIRGDSTFKGASVGITWGSLEPRKGVYDFSAVDAELAMLRAVGKRLIVEVWATNYWHETPSTPQSGNRYVPDYLIDEGLVGRVKEGGYTAAWSNPRTMDYFIPLAKALCQRYEQEPLIEQFVFGETAIDGAQEFPRLVRAVGDACNNTVPVLHMNYVNNPELARELVALGAEYGVGIGGPDILPPKPISPYGEDHASLVLRGAGYTETGGYYGDYGKTDYRGVVPISFQYQGIHNITPAALIDYALNTQKGTHITWSVITHLSPAMNWSTGVVPTLRAQSRSVSTACPTTFRNACQSQ